MRNFSNLRLESAYQGSLDIFRQLLSHAVLYEKKFNYETILKWRQINKLSSPWQVDQAKYLLSIDKNKANTISNDLKSENSSILDSTPEILQDILSNYRSKTSEASKNISN